MSDIINKIRSSFNIKKILQENEGVGCINYNYEKLKIKNLNQQQKYTR